MYVIPPINTPVDDTDFAITAAMLTSTPVAEPDAGEVVYDPTTNHAAGDQVISTTTHRTYEALHGERHTVTVTIAAPAVIGWANHGLSAGTPFVFSQTTGALPTGFTVGTTYYVLADTVDTFKLAASLGGSAINATGSQSGVHTGIADPVKGIDPTTDTQAEHWAEVGPTNRWRMFDILRNTATTYASPFEVVLTPGQRIDAVGLVGLVADEVTITVESGGAEVYSYTQNLLVRYPTNWLEWTVDEFRQVGEVAVSDIPPYTDGVITLTLVRAAGDVSVGGVVIGRQIQLGDIQWSPDIDKLNFSTIDRDASGKSRLKARRNVPKTSQQVRCSKSRVNRILQAQDDLNAVPALWSGLDDATDGYFGALLILGIYKRWSLTLDLPDYAMQQLELEEV